MVRSLLVVRWHMCKDLQKRQKTWWLPPCWSWWYCNTIWVFTLWQYAELFTKSGASYICLYHHGKTKDLCGNSVKAARTKANPNDSSGELTSLSVIPTYMLHLFMRSQYLWKWRRLLLLRNMLGKADSPLVQGKTRLYSLAVIGFYQKADACSTLFPKLYVLMARTRQTMKADHCWHFLWKIQMERLLWLSGALPQMKDLGFSVGCSKKPFLCFLVNNHYIPWNKSWLTVTPKKSLKLTLPSPHILSMQYVLHVGGTLLNKAGDKIVKVSVIGEGRMMLLGGR